MKKIAGLWALIILITLGLTHLAAAPEPYTPPRGSSERHAILEALRQALKHFPATDPAGLGFAYKREDVRIDPQINIVFHVHHLRVKNDWAWVEASGKNYLLDIDALLCKKQGKWQVMGLVNPRYVVCADPSECLEVRTCLYKKFRQKFPAPPEIFPPENPATKPILAALRQAILPTLGQENLVFIVRYLKVKNLWAWIDTHPRTPDGWGQFEPLAALLHQENGHWKVKSLRLAGEECPNDSEEGAEARYYRKLRRDFPGLPPDIFPK